jgi:DNA replication protein DnaC
MNSAINESINLYAKILKMPTFTQYQDVIRQLKPSMGLEDMLLELMKKECHSRQENQLKRRIRTAHFPVTKTLEELNMSCFENIKPTFIQQLASCDFINKRNNIIMIGPPGTGKTHLAIGLGMKACAFGYKVLFRTAATLSTELCEAKDAYKLSKLENSIEKADLLILDELSYLSFNRHQSDLLFKVVSERSERASIIVTTNLEFSRWTEMFENETMVAALVDRLTFKSHLLDMNGSSYRLNNVFTND